MSNLNYSGRQLQTKQSDKVIVAQISDPHLFKDTEQCHHGANVYHNLTQVLQSVSSNTDIDLLIFTGDLTQDHTEKSYQRFVEIFTDIKMKATYFIPPTFFTPGNHDEVERLNEYLNKPPFYEDKTINIGSWQIQLLNSKSKAPAGLVSKPELLRLKKSINENKNQFIFMHHHPIDVGYFIDKHGLINKDEFWREISLLNQAAHQQGSNSNIKAVACGHVHGAMDFPAFSKGSWQCASVLTCPATSIQFDPTKEHVAALPLSGGYRLITLHQSGNFETKVLYV